MSMSMASLTSMSMSMTSAVPITTPVMPVLVNVKIVSTGWLGNILNIIIVIEVLGGRLGTSNHLSWTTVIRTNSGKLDPIEEFGHE